MIFINVSVADLIIAIYSAVISSIFIIPPRDHRFPRAALPHMLIKVQQRGETLCTHLGVDISVNGVSSNDRDRIGADRN